MVDKAVFIGIGVAVCAVVTYFNAAQSLDVQLGIAQVDFAPIIVKCVVVGVGIYVGMLLFSGDKKKEEEEA